MGIFDNNIHMNGAGTTYQAFLDLADAAEKKDGKLGDRTVRLVKAGDGKKLAEQFFQFVAKTNAMITDKAEIEAVAGSDDYSAFVGTATDLLFVMHPEIGEGVRGLDAGSRAKLFDDAMQASTDKSSELQNKNKDGLDKLQQMAIGLEARHWSAATACTMQLQAFTGTTVVVR